MVATASLRPGVLHGSYPQREDSQQSWLDRAAHRVAGIVKQRTGAQTGRLSTVVARVRSAGKAFASLSDGQLAIETTELRRRLRSEGLQDELAIRSFALIREGAARSLGMRHFDVQIMGGWVMLQGMVAEMQTGEGKTLTATLPACTAALAGIPVHVVTVNDYLVTRDAAWMAPLYELLGLTVGAITEPMDPAGRREAYARDITYCTGKQLVFDYLKDRLVLGRTTGRLRLQLEGLHQDRPRVEQLLLRGLCFAVVDEADSVLIDEARTPLIISRGTEGQSHQQTYHQALQLARSLAVARDFRLQQRLRNVELTDQGKERLCQLAAPLGGVWRNGLHRENLVRQALYAVHLFERDTHYLLKDGRVQIIDEYTGRVMRDRSWERGLHQMVEAKEGCDITGIQDTAARISYQRFFGRYLRLSGMTGTAREVGGELWSEYGLNVVTIPTNRPLRRRHHPDRVFLTQSAKWAAIVARVKELHVIGRPVLIGTRSVAASEHLSKLLADAGLAHEVLNAKQDDREAEIIERAGRRGTITVATNMAGRGTDIHLEPGVEELGGLHVIATERHDAGRIDRQLFGRCGRQGDPGSFEAMIALDDELIENHSPASLRQLVGASCRVSGPVGRALGLATSRLAQRAAERKHRRLRRHLRSLDERLGDLLAFSGSAE